VCLIVDANAAGQFLARRSSITDWLLGKKGNPRLVAGGKLMEELARLDKVRRLLTQLDRAGSLRSAKANSLQREEGRLRAGGRCHSNDFHVLALAIVSGARTLATFDKLWQATSDMQESLIVRGSVYHNESHAHLLRHTPASCGVRSTEAQRKQRRR